MSLLGFLRQDGPYTHLILLAAFATLVLGIVAFVVSLVKPTHAALPAGLTLLAVFLSGCFAVVRAAYMSSRVDQLGALSLGAGTNERILHIASIEGAATPKVAVYGLVLPFLLGTLALVIGLVRKKGAPASGGATVFASVAAILATLALLGASVLAFRAPRGRDLSSDEAFLLDTASQLESSPQIECTHFLSWLENRLREPEIRPEMMNGVSVLGVAKRCADKMRSGDVRKEPFLTSTAFLAALPEELRQEVKSWRVKTPEELFGLLDGSDLFPGGDLNGTGNGLYGLKNPGQGFGNQGQGFGGLQGIGKQGTLGGQGLGLNARGAPSLRQGALEVNGRLPPEVIQRIVRQNFGRFRLCYENGLRSNPSLEGKVVVKFVIDRSGAVASARDGGSDLPDPAVQACVIRGFRNLSFPQPEGGIVTVSYPIIFASAK